MEPIQIFSGAAEVIAASTIVSFGGEPVTIEYGGPPEGKMKLVFRFLADPSKPPQQITSSLLDPTTLQIDLLNFDSPLPAGTLKPMMLGSFNGKALYLHFRAAALQSGDKQVHFTLFVKAKPRE